MSIEHKDIVDPDIHEPKGIAAASANRVYVADGAGSGTWDQVDSSALKGLSGDAAVADKILVTDGSNGFDLITGFAYGSMVISGNTNAFSVTAAVDATLATTTDYALFTGTGAPWASETLSGVTFNTNRLIVPVAGVYELSAWANISEFPSNVTLVGMKYRVNGTTFSTRHVREKANSTADSGNLNMTELISLSASDYVQVYFASSVTGSLTIANANIMLKLIKAT